ncbi:MAG: helix-turn-helix transcriptional regulator [Oligoflexales bacterium]|nr:helix-turn-helix transcriptional regulator [Oligoflexales bacterium]
MAKGLREIVANNIRDLRIQAGLTQVELAKKAKLTDVYISRIEQKSKNLTLDSIEQIANALEVPISSLIKDVSTTFPKQNKKTANSIRHAIKVLELYLQTIENENS